MSRFYSGDAEALRDEHIPDELPSVYFLFLTAGGRALLRAGADA